MTELRFFDATVSAPSSVPLLGWAVDTFMVLVGGCCELVGGWLPLCVRLRWLHTLRTLRTLPSLHLACLHQTCRTSVEGLVPFLALQPAAP